MYKRKSSILKKGKYPDKVRERFERLRNELPFPITIFKVAGYYYVVRQEYSRDEKGNVTRKKPEYIGSITADGIFKFKRTGTESEVEVAKAILREHGEKIVPREQLVEQANGEKVETSIVENDILTNLTMNARMPIEMLAENVGIKPRRAAYLKALLEKNLNISYIPDVRLTKIGFLEFMVFVKFAGRSPDPELVKVELKEIGEVQFAAFTSGIYDMLLFVIAESNENLAEIVKKIKGIPSLLSLSSTWEISYFYKTKSFIPLREEAMKVLENKVWRRTKERPRPGYNDLLESEFKVIKALVRNGAAKFSEMEAEEGIVRGGARHAYDRLMQREILPRVTISVDGIGVKSNGIIIMKITNEKLFQESRKRLLEFIMEEQKNYIVNRFSLVGDTSNPEGVIFFIPIINGNELEETVSEINAAIKGIKLKKLTTTTILLGKIPYRRIDPLTSNQNMRLILEYKIKSESPRIYDEETFYKLRKFKKKVHTEEYD